MSTSICVLMLLPQVSRYQQDLSPVCNENLYLLQYLAATPSQRAPLSDETSTVLSLVSPDSVSSSSPSSSSSSDFSSSSDSSSSDSAAKKRKKKATTSAASVKMEEVEESQPEEKKQPEKQPNMKQQVKKEQAATAPPDLKSLFSSPSSVAKGKLNKPHKPASMKTEDDDSNLSSLGKAKLKNKRARA